MKVLVLGAGGRTGRAVVQRAVAAGHTVTAFVHDADTYDPPDGVTVAAGDATDATVVSEAVEGQDAVIDTIGGSRPYKSDLTLERDVVAAVIAAMHRHGVDRLVVTSSLGVGDSTANATAMVRLLVVTFLRGSTKDKAAMESAVRASGLAWTIARPAVLSDDPATGGVHVLDPASGTKAHQTTRADLAAWLVAQLDDDSHVHGAPTIATS